MNDKIVVLKLYLEEKTRCKFKAATAQLGKDMSTVLREFINNYIFEYEREKKDGKF